ncbi:MAG: hypothetical protein PHP23_07490 [Desulfobacterales bacterium]|nr:hypothetical protein [Desulfobacterales bacterium]MDD4393655.1 hypothetical protein [Desulfobacterales bacterium]
MSHFEPHKCGSMLCWHCNIAIVWYHIILPEDVLYLTHARTC